MVDRVSERDGSAPASPTAESGGPLARFAEVTALFAVSGILAQALAFVAAVAFYRKFSLAPDQLGITPLNALLRMPSTSLFALCFMGILSLAAVLVVNRRKGSHRRLFAPLRVLRESLPGIAASALVVAILLTFPFHYLGRSAGDASRSLDGDPVALSNPVLGDLFPAGGFLRWTTKEEFPAQLMGTQLAEVNRPVLYLGTQNTVTYFYDTLLHRTFAVPATQVQISLYPTP